MITDGDDLLGREADNVARYSTTAPLFASF